MSDEIKIDNKNKVIYIPPGWTISVKEKPKLEYKTGDVVVEGLNRQTCLITNDKESCFETLNHKGHYAYFFNHLIFRHATEEERKEYWRSRAEAIPDGTWIMCENKNNGTKWVDRKCGVNRRGEITGHILLCGHLDFDHYLKAKILPKHIAEELEKL